MGAKILVVEDEVALLDLWKVTFTLEGYSVITAADGAEGLDKARRERPDAILTDVNMPGMDGVEMIRTLRGWPDFPKVPIVAMTARGRRTGAAARGAGADEVVYKPATPDQIIGIVGRLLNSRGQVQGV